MTVDDDDVHPGRHLGPKCRLPDGERGLERHSGRPIGAVGVLEQRGHPDHPDAGALQPAHPVAYPGHHRDRGGRIEGV